MVELDTNSLPEPAPRRDPRYPNNGHTVSLRGNAMRRYDDLRTKLGKSASLSKLSESDIVALRKLWEGLPEDYLGFLGEVGFGNLGDIQLYSGPARADSIFSPMPEHLEAILLIGDDMQGNCFGFDTGNSFRLVEIAPSGTIDFTVEPDFTSLLHGYFG